MNIGYPPTAKFALIPPTTGTDKNSNILLVPDIEVIANFSKGDLGISESIKSEFIYNQIASSTMDEEATSIFLKSSGISLPKDIGDYKTKSGRLKIPKEDMSSTLDSGLMGMKAIEKTIIKSIFEQQKPFMEVAMASVKTFGKLEDIVSMVIPTVFPPYFKSLKPIINPKSISYKMSTIEEKINEVENLGKNKKDSKFKILNTEQKKKGINLIDDKLISQDKLVIDNIGDNYEWEILSTEYSTGVKLDGIDYKIIYKDIIDKDIILDGLSSDNKSNIKEDEKPNTIVVGYYDQFGRDSDPPSWLDATYEGGGRKWFGKFEQLKGNDADKSIYEPHLKDKVRDRVEKILKVDDNKIVNDIFEFIKPKIEIDDFIKDANKNCFMNLINFKKDDLDGGGNPKGYDLANDSTIDVGIVTGNKRFMFLPKKIKYKGKNMIVDPESDYDLQIIKVTVSNANNTYYSGSPTYVNVNDDHLKSPNPYVNNYLGVDLKDKLPKKYWNDKNFDNPKDSKRRVHNINRYRRRILINPDFYDEKVYYIVEGVLNTEEKKENKNVSENNKYYRKRHIFQAISKSIDIFIGLFTELIPTIQTALKLYKNPHEFLFDISLEKIGENFEFLNPDLLKKFSQISNIKNISDRINFVTTDNILKKFVTIDLDGKFRFILDGVGSFDLLGINFGIGLSNLIPKLILEKGSSGTKCGLGPTKKSINPNWLDTRKTALEEKMGGSKSNGLTSENIKNMNIVSGETIWETVSIKYSTGERIDNVDYEYIYVTQEVDKLLKDADDMLKLAAASDISGGDVDLALKALENYNKAQIQDPNNKIINEKIDELKSKFKVNLQMVFTFILNLISYPIKLAICILESILDFFLSLAVRKLPTLITDFLSFKWILKFFTPSFIIETLGIRFDPSIVTKWLSDIKSKGSDLKNMKFNLDQIIATPFISKLPEVNVEELEEILKGGLKPLLLVTNIFKFIEQLINEIICFIWNILNIDAIIPCPVLNLSKFAGGDLDNDQIQSILNGEDNNILNSYDQSQIGDNNMAPNNWIFDIKLSNGEVIKGLNRVELESFVKKNNDLKYEFTNFKSI